MAEADIFWIPAFAGMTFVHRDATAYCVWVKCLEGGRHDRGGFSPYHPEGGLGVAPQTPTTSLARATLGTFASAIAAERCW